MKKFLLFIIVLLLSSFFVINTNAEVTYNIEKSEYVEGTITVKGDNSTYGGASKLTLKGSDNSTITAYCTDPYAPAATGNKVTYREVSINESDKAAYESIWSTTCGDEKSAVPAVKTYMTNYSDTVGYRAETAYAYAGVLNGESNYSGNRDELLSLVEGARTAASSTNGDSSKGGVSISQSGNSVTISGEDGSYSVSDGSGYSCIVSTIGGKKVTKCSLDEEFCKPSNPDGTIEVPVTTYDGTGTPSSNPECECKARMFEVASGASGSQNQRFVACEKVNSGSGGSGGSGADSPSGEGAGNTEYIPLSCDGYEEEEDFCDVPCETFYDYIGEEGGSEYCDASGSVVVEVEEFGYSDSYEDTFCCLQENVEKKGNINGVEATNTILGEHISLCEAYCTDKSYSLSLPGPTSDNFDEAVMVNAGTFFTIDGEMKSESEIECYVTADYNALVSKVNQLRNALAQAITNLNIKTAEKGAIWDPIEHRDEDGYYEQIPYCSSSSSYPVLNGDQCCYEDGSRCRDAYTRDGDWIVTNVTITWEGRYIIPTYKKVVFNSSGDNGGSYSDEYVYEHSQSCGTISSKNDYCAEYESLKNIDLKPYKETVDQLQEDLTITNVEHPKTKIDELLNQWDYCLTGWGFDTPDGFNAKIENEANNCYTKLNFTYEDGEILGISPGITATVEGVQKHNKPQKFGEEAGTKPLKIGSCDDSGACNENTYTVPYSKDFTYNENKVTTTYEFHNKFCSPFDENKDIYYLTGDDSTCNGIVLEGFPVSLHTPQGEYSYRYEYEGIGYLYDTATSESCVGRLEPFIFVDYDSYDNTCKYNVNNCRYCDVGCIDKGDDSCDIEFGYECSNKCKVTCVGGGCIFDSGSGFLATYRTISLNNPFLIANANMNFNPNVLIAYNLPSSTRYFPTSNWKTDKGDWVKSEISSAGESIYNNEPQYAIDLTPGAIKDIQDYNKEHPDYFSKENLSCEIKDGTYAICTSKFIDEFGEIFEINDRNWYSYSGYEDEKFTGPALK